MLVFSVGGDMSDILKTQEIYTLVNPDWFRAAGLSKGLDHDRQHLGILLNAGNTLSIRQIDAGFTGTLRLRLLNNSAGTEKSVSVGKDWVDVSVDYPSVPFIDTPYVQGNPKIEFKYPPDAKRLPVIRWGERSDSFFASWDEQAAEFALLESRKMRILSPAGDKENVRQTGVDTLMLHYDGVVELYESLCGVSFEPEHPTDANVRNRFFMKADEQGAGGAYYGGAWFANSEPRLYTWVTNLRTDWGSLHEIGHGFQGSFLSSSAVSLSEVWNNIYAATYQDITLGDDKYKYGWLYGNTPKLVAGVTAAIEAGTPLNAWSLSQKLYFMMLMKYKGGSDGFMQFNQAYRMLANTLPKPPIAPVIEMLAAAYADKGSVDVMPFVKLVGGDVAVTQQDLNVFSHAKALYPVYKLVSEENLQSVMSTLSLDTSLRLVDSVELKQTNLVGDVNLHFAIDDFIEIYGESLTLMEGPRVAGVFTIDEPDMVLENLPIGVYTLRVPTGFDRKYAVDTYYLPVSEGTSELALTYTQKQGSNIVTQQLMLLGLGDYHFGTVTVDACAEQVIVDVSKSPHSYFKGELYASIELLDEAGSRVFFRDVFGDDTRLTHDEVPCKSGYSIVVYHAEPGRLRVAPVAPGVVLNTKTNAFLITEMGLKNAAAPNYDPSENLRARIAEAAAVMRQNLPLLSAPHAERKDDMLLAVNVFTEPERSILMTEYAGLMPHNNTRPGPGIGNLFDVEMRGLGNWLYFKARIDLVRSEIRIEVMRGEPHAYFKDTYAYVCFRNESGQELFAYDFVGTAKSTSLVRTIALTPYGGEQMYTHNEEHGARAVVVNQLQGNTLQLAGNSVQTLIRNGDALDNDAGSEILVTPTVRGNFLDWVLMGALDVRVAQLNINLVDNVLKVVVDPVVPSQLVTGTFISIHVEDKFGQVVFSVNLKGNQRAEAVDKTFALQKGYTINVTHLEPGRSILVNTETKAEQSMDGVKATYRTIPRGLLAVTD